VKIKFPKTLPLTQSGWRLALPSLVLPGTAFLRSRPVRAGGFAGAAVLGAVALALVLQAHSPDTAETVANAAEAEVASGQADQPVSEATEKSASSSDDLPHSANPASAASLPVIEKAEKLALLEDDRRDEPALPARERWAVAEPQTELMAGQQALQPSPPSEASDIGANAFALPSSLTPDPTMTTAIAPDADLDGPPDGTGVAIAESEAEVAALETRMAGRDSHVFAAMSEPTQTGAQGRVTEYVNMRASPDNDAEILKVLPANSPVSLLDHCPNWCEVEHEGARGFVYGSFVERNETAAALPATAAEE
jgi:hypothetical protein